jgi:hypothetical protein
MLIIGAPKLEVAPSRANRAGPNATTADSIAGASSSRRETTPRRSSTLTPQGWIPWVEGTSLGKRDRSITQTRKPARAKKAARGDPAQRPPTTMTSKRSMTTL